MNTKDATTLTECYVDTAMRTVPEAQRSDLSAELRALIADQVDARIDAGEGVAEAERTVLQELGDPDALAASYAGRPLHLIGSRYFLTWWRLLKLLLWIVLPLVALGATIAASLGGAPVGEIVGTVSVVLLHTAVHLAFWSALAFVVVERVSKGDRPRRVSGWTVDDLAEPRPKDVSPGNVAGAVLIRVAFVGFLAVDRFFLPLYSPDRGMSLINPDLWPWWTTGLFVIMALDIAVVAIASAVGRWTPPLAVARIVLTACAVIPALWLTFTGRLMDPAVWAHLQSSVAGDTGVTLLAIVTGFGIATMATWFCIYTWQRSRR